MLTAQTVRDILALEKQGLPFDTLVDRLVERFKSVTRNEVMSLVLELSSKGQVTYDVEVGTWRSTVRLV